MSEQLSHQKIESLEHTLESLQIKIAYQEDTIESLNQTVIEQQKNIDLMKFKLEKIIEKVNSIPDSSSDSSDKIELPPHY